MGVLRKIFGPSQAEIWQQLCKEIGADFVKGGLWKGNKVQAYVGEWTVTLDTYTVSNGKTLTTYTRIRAPYVNMDGFRFTIYRKTLFSDLGKFFGMQDIEIGDPEFDRDFIIKSNTAPKAMALFSNQKIRRLIQAQPSILLQVKGDESWFGTSFPQGVDELYFQVPGVIKDLERLKALYELFAEVLNHLCHIGSAYETDARLNLRVTGP
jgi:hypothetical protein